MAMVLLQELDTYLQEMDDYERGRLTGLVATEVIRELATLGAGRVLGATKLAQGAQNAANRLSQAINQKAGWMSPSQRSGVASRLGNVSTSLNAVQNAFGSAGNVGKLLAKAPALQGVAPGKDKVIALGRALKQIREDRKRARDADNLENGTNRQGPEFDADEKDEIQVILAHVQNEMLADFDPATGNLADLPTVAEFQAAFGGTGGVLGALGENDHHIFPKAKLRQLYRAAYGRRLSKDEVDSMPGFLVPGFRHQGVAGTKSGYHQFERARAGEIKAGRDGGLTPPEIVQSVVDAYERLDQAHGVTDGVDYSKLGTVAERILESFSLDPQTGGPLSP
ncbi:MAG: hypothetical protein AAFS11_07120 [Planctomycetota bacterium]